KGLKVAGSGLANASHVSAAISAMRDSTSTRVCSTLLMVLWRCLGSPCANLPQSGTVTAADRSWEGGAATATCGDGPWARRRQCWAKAGSLGSEAQSEKIRHMAQRRARSHSKRGASRLIAFKDWCIGKARRRRPLAPRADGPAEERQLDRARGKKAARTLDELDVDREKGDLARRGT